MGKGKKKRQGPPRQKRPFQHENPFKRLKGVRVQDPPAPETKLIETTLESSPSEGLELWQQFYQDVEPFAQGETVPPPPPKRVPPVERSSEEDALTQLSDLVSGEGEFRIDFLAEYVTGLAPGIDPRLLKRLKAGQFSCQAHLDLHGYTWSVAREVILEFITTARYDGKRCVLIVHGRGLHSKDAIATLKNNLISLLTRGPLRRKVLAFSSARPVDGGPGAMYILLRKGRALHG